MHERKQIREKIVQLLKTGVPIIGSDPTQYMKLDVDQRVYSERPDPIFPEEVPIALVYFVGESVQTGSSRNIMDRILSVNVDIYDSRRQNLENELDRLSWQTEIILLTDFTLGLCFVHWIELVNVVPYQVDLESEQFKGVCRMTFNVKYDTERYSPGTLDEFLNYGIEIRTPESGNPPNAAIGFNTTIREE